MLLSGCSLPRRVYSAARLRELDHRAVERGLPGIELMERAGRAAWQLLEALWPEARRLVVLCGNGNNGGDALVLARLAREAGRAVCVTAPVAGTPHGVAAEAAQRWSEAGGTVQDWEPGVMEGCDVVVDGLLGIGLQQEVRAPLAAVIETVRTGNWPVFALDLPSGLCPDTGQVLGVALPAAATLSFVGLKPGLFTGRGAEFTGTVYCSELDLPPEWHQEAPSVCGRLELTDFDEFLAPRARTAHKGSFGHVLVVGGAVGYGGAVALTASAAVRCGAGLVSALLLDRPLRGAMAPEIMARVLAKGKTVPPAQLLERTKVLAVGPGLGTTPRSLELLRRLLAQAWERSWCGVLDADALNLIAAEPKLPTGRDAWVYTPHPGEAARLLGWSVERLQSDRLAAARALWEQRGGTVVLKGAGTLVVDETGLDLCATANPGLATGGTGDVLTGVIAALLAQGLARPVAARLGVCLHAAAATVAVADGERGLRASDLLPCLRHLVNPGQPRLDPLPASNEAARAADPR